MRISRTRLTSGLSWSRITHLVPHQEVGQADFAVSDHDPRGVHREAMCARAPVSLPSRALPWRARSAREAETAHRAEAARECHAPVHLVALDSQQTEGSKR